LIDNGMVGTLTFSTTVNPIRYVGANPVLLDSEAVSWNMDPRILEDVLRRRARAGRRPAALVVVHLYGQSADLSTIQSICAQYGVPIIEDAAKALGASYGGIQPGTVGRAGIFSFNGNKIITTGGGGMLVTKDADFARHVRKLATQARDPAPHYEHSEIGYNYRLSNVLAAIGRGQLRVLEDRVRARRRNFEAYVTELGDLPGLAFQPEASWGRHARWLTCVQVDPGAFGVDRETIRVALEAENIESRPLWKPRHLQPVFAGCEVFGGSVAEGLFRRGLCLPSGSALGDAARARVVDVVRRLHARPVGG
jgi:pyridoxal phosphate-dependent aminotransferase EpsN